MILDLNELRAKTEPVRITSDFNEQQLQIGETIAKLDKPAHAELRVRMSGEHVFIDGVLSASLRVTCCRCANLFPQQVEKSFRLEYWPDPEVLREGEEFELSYDDLNIGFYREDQVDLSAVVSEQILLDIPMKPVCRESCKGLCDQCGADLNQGDCDCSKERLDPRLAGLAEIKDRIIH
jgi:uncharacterized protein